MVDRVVTFKRVGSGLYQVFADGWPVGTIKRTGTDRHRPWAYFGGQGWSRPSKTLVGAKRAVSTYLRGKPPRALR